MVPLKLTLKNFICYRDQVPTLDLEGVRLACLSGQNGHGKSALLDAITWALWGRARGKNQDELIYYGADEMQVELEFKVRDARYRVERRHARAGSRSRRGGHSDLQLQIFDGANLVPITGNTIRETQARIEQLVGLDYETFINSAYLVQGRADEFTNRTPGERKEVLAKVLGLMEYEGLQDRARDRTREKQREADAIEANLEQSGQEVLRKGELQEELQSVQAELSQVDLRLQVKRSEVEAIKNRLETLQSRRDELGELERRVPRLQQELEQLQRQAQLHSERIAQYGDTLAGKDSIIADKNELEAVRTRYLEMEPGRSEYERLDRRSAELATAIAAQMSRLEEQARQWERRVAEELRPAADSVPDLEGKLTAAVADLQAYGKEEGSLEEQRQRAGALAGEAGRLQASMETLHVEGDGLNARLNLLKNTDGHATCPLCGTALADDGCRHLIDVYQADIEDKRRQYVQAQSNLKETERMKGELEATVEASEASLRHRQAQSQQKVATLQGGLRNASQAQTDLAVALEKAAGIRQLMDKGQYAQEEQGEQAAVGLQMSELDYQPKGFALVQRQLQELQPAEAKYQRLLDAETALPQEEEALAASKAMAENRLEEVEDARQRRGTLEEETSQLPDLEVRHRNASSEMAKEEDAQRRLLARQGSLGGELSRIENLMRQTAVDQRRLAQLREEEGIYQELAVAFGRQGVQAMLIETLLPRLEEEANVLLGRMTDQRMSLNLEAQRERRGRQGAPIETLDIKINDELGPRSYEMFSGGEAFRINLSLRIALSKVLAHRQGAPLPTLFIDEGFGTQDASGRERILDVISAIEPDFEKIIVITHLEDLREAFPVRIQVEKGEDGATVWLE